MVLGGNGAKNDGPNPDRVRDRNSPILPAMRQHSHTGNYANSVSSVNALHILRQDRNH